MTTSTRPASTNPTTGEGRPGCGEADGVRWCDSTVGRDTLLHRMRAPLDDPHRRTDPSARQGGDLMRDESAPTRGDGHRYRSQPQLDLILPAFVGSSSASPGPASFC